MINKYKIFLRGYKNVVDNNIKIGIVRKYCFFEKEFGEIMRGNFNMRFKYILLLVVGIFNFFLLDDILLKEID